MPFHQHRLSNGLQIIAETSPSARSVALGFFVRTGSRDETPEVSGVTHFLEHMVFKGTPNRTALEVNRDFDRIGANYNAYTSEENTVFHAAILPEYLPQAVDILTDILQPSLRVEDFDMEKNVIIEEIGMYEDQPMWLAYDNAKQLYFADHALGNSILGTPDSIRALERDQMNEYFQRRYVAPNITVSAAGNFDFAEFVKLIEQHCGAWKSGPAPRTGIRHTQGSGGFRVMLKDKISQEHVIMIASGPPADHALRYAADTLAVALGDDSGSRLYWALVDPGLAESADVSYHEYDGTGSFYTFFSCDPDNVEQDLDIVNGIFATAQQEGITEQELHSAKSKILSHLVRAGERPKGRMQSIGRTWVYLQQYRSVDEELAAFDAVTLADIRQLLDAYPLDRQTILALGPLEEVKGAKVS